MNHSSSSPGGRPASMGPPRALEPPGLSRYVSAPGSFLAALADSVVHGGEDYSAVASMGGYFSGDSSCLTTSEPRRLPGPQSSERPPQRPPQRPQPQPQRAYGLEELPAAADLSARVGVGVEDCGGIPLVRHSSLPAGFFSHLFVDQGPSTSMGIGSYSQADTNMANSLAAKRLRPQWSFSRQDSLSQISEFSIPEMEENGARNSSDEAVGHAGQSYISGDFHLGPWDDNSIVFSSPSKRIKDGNIVSSIGNQFNLSKSALDMSTVDDYLMNQDSVPCKVRAKRGCATHPRSVAERERRTRISKRLRKLQDLVPNMDKQTSTSDMLELAIQHIKELQSKVEKLKHEEANCTCGNRKA